MSVLYEDLTEENRVSKYCLVCDLWYSRKLGLCGLCEILKIPEFSCEAGLTRDQGSST